VEDAGLRLSSLISYWGQRGKYEWNGVEEGRVICAAGSLGERKRDARINILNRLPTAIKRAISIHRALYVGLPKAACVRSALRRQANDKPKGVPPSPRRHTVPLRAPHSGQIRDFLSTHARQGGDVQAEGKLLSTHLRSFSLGLRYLRSKGTLPSAN